MLKPNEQYHIIVPSVQLEYPIGSCFPELKPLARVVFEPLSIQMSKYPRNSSLVDQSFLLVNRGSYCHQNVYFLIQELVLASCSPYCTRLFSNRWFFQAPCSYEVNLISLAWKLLISWWTAVATGRPSFGHQS